MKLLFKTTPILILILSLSGCGCTDGKKKTAGNQINDDELYEQIDFDSVGISGKTRDAVMELITGDTYYLDPALGDDETGNGSSGSPWKTLAKAQATAKSGDGVILRAGNYGDYVEDAYYNVDCWIGRSSWIIYINEEGALPVFTKIRLRYPSSLDGPGFVAKGYPEITDSYLIFWGITIIPAEIVNGTNVGELDPVWYTGTNKTNFDNWKAANPAILDSMYPESAINTYMKTEPPFHIWRAQKVQMYNSTIRGPEKNLTKNAVDILNSNDLLFQNNDISRCNSAFKYSNTSNITIRGNHLHEFVSSGISEGQGNNMRLIEGNHIHNSRWSVTEPWVPKAKGQNYHGSGMSLRYGNVVIRGNIFHNGWDSAGMMTYDDYKGAFHNVLFENNLFYDIHTTTLRLGNAGENIVIRNNTFIGYFREDTNGYAYKYFSVLVVESLYPGFDGSGISLYNNVFCGGVFLNDAKVVEYNNIFWSLLKNRGSIQWEPAGLSSTNSYIVTPNFYDTSGNYPQYFAESFFNTDPVFTKYHGTMQDFSLAEGSPGINFGNPGYQPSKSLGSLDSNNAFILDDGLQRDSGRHSAGAYERD